MSKKSQIRSDKGAATATGSLSFDSGTRTVEIVYSTGARVDRYDFFEDLVVSVDAIDASRLDAGAVNLICDHMPYGMPLGRVIGHRIDGRNAIATVRLSDSSKAQDAIADIQSGVIRNVSVGYEVHAFKDADQDGVRVRTVTRWMPLEISLVIIPADPAAHIRSKTAHHSRTEVCMSRKNQKRDAQVDETDLNAVDDATTEVAEAVEEIAEEIVDTLEAAGADAAEVAEIEGDLDEVQEAADEADELAADLADNEGAEEVADVTAERSRIAEIVDYAARHRLSARSVTRFIESGANVKQVRNAVARARAGKSPKPLSRARILRDEQQTAHKRAANEIYRRLSGKETGSRDEMRNMSLVDIARNFVPNSRGMDRFRVARSAGMHTTSDFNFTSAITGAMERVVRDRIATVKPALEQITRTTQHRDFREVDTYSVGGFPTLLETPEGAEYKAGSINTETGTLNIRKYGRVLNLSFEAIVNDDLDLFRRAIDGTAAAGIKMKNRLIREALKGKTGDGRALFHTSHKNLITGGALDVENLSKARVLMRQFVDIDGEPMDLESRYLIVSTADETDADRVLSVIAPSITGEVNPFAGTLEKIVDPSLEPGEWILAADPDYGDHIQIAELDGYQGVNVEEIFHPMVDGFTWRARAFAGAAPTGYRGLVKVTR